MEYETILVEKREGIPVITLNRPEKLNAINPQMRREFLSVLDELGADEATRVIIVTGAGRAFCAGADVGMFEETKCELEGPRSRTDDIPKEIYEFEKPIIGAINGIAAGDGAQWLLAFDLNVASEAAKLAWPATRFGLL